MSNTDEILRMAELESAQPDGAVSNVELQEIRQRNLGRRLMLSYRFFEHACLSALQELGFGDIRMTHLTILPHISERGVRTTKIATAANLTKQAISQLTVELEAADYVESIADPSDRRAKLIVFTDKGKRLLRSLPVVLHRGEKSIETIIGVESVDEIYRDLGKVADAWGDRNPDNLNVVTL